MSSPESLRAQAVRLLALAIEARGRGDEALSELHVARAMQLQDEATALEDAARRPPIAPEGSQPNAQQQEQVQPEKPEK
jgi:hypothetical protein